MLIELDQLRNVYPQSESYRSALFWAGVLFADKGDWATGVRYYQPLAEAAPTTDLGRRMRQPRQRRGDRHWPRRSRRSRRVSPLGLAFARRRPAKSLALS